MFLVTQIIGLIVINAYTPRIEKVVINGIEQNISLSPQLPYGMQPPEMPKGTSLVTIIISFAIAIFVIFLLSKFKAKWFLKIWFFAVVVLALGITLYALFFYLKIPYGALIALLIALPLAIYKIFKQHILIHNLTELMIYPGIAAVFIPILGVLGIILLSGCTQASENLSKAVSTEKYIGGLQGYVEDNALSIYYRIFDENNNYYTPDGQVSVRIVNTNGVTVYTKTLNVYSTSYSSYTNTLTNEKFTACKLSIPLNEFSKTNNSYGTIYLSFT